MLRPIWKDYFVSFGNEDVVDYNIGYMSGDEFVEVYSGRAFKKPTSDSLDIKINDICHDFIKHTLPILSQEEYDSITLPVKFQVNRVHSYGGVELVDEVEFTNDWSYDYGFDYATRESLSSPINGHIDSRQWLFWTNLNKEDVTAMVTLKTGETFPIIVDVSGSADFNEDFNNDFAKSLRSTGLRTISLNLSEWDVAKVVINDVEYHSVNGCPRYCLYYINAYGGWDSFLIEGSAKEVDNLTRETFSRICDNRNSSNREKVNHLTEITKRITLNTSWLSDAQSLRMHNLLNSTDVYLHDLDNGLLHPVVLVNGSTEYKTYKTNGGKLVNYSFEVEFANKRVRR